LKKRKSRKRLAVAAVTNLENMQMKEKGFAATV
jgi:hypothetical protein